MITAAGLHSVKVTIQTAAKYISALQAAMAKHQIDTSLRMCHFLAQLLEESRMLESMVENLNYDASGLLKTFPLHFTAKTAAEYAHHPHAIANHVYANRYGNGDENSGDGYRYRGRGGFQITFKDNYAAEAKELGIDLVGHPEFLELPVNAMMSAANYWNRHHLNELADRDNILLITEKVNGGIHGLNARTELLSKLKEVFIPHQA